MKHVTQVFSTKVADYGLKFVTSVLIARYLGPADKGILTFALLVVGWTVSFGNLSWTDATVYLVGKGNYALAQVVAASCWFSLLAGGVYGLGLFAVVHFQIVHWPVGDPQLFYLLLFLIPLNLLLNNFVSILQGLHSFREYNFFSILRSAFFLATVLGALWLAQQRLMGIALATVLASALCALTLGVYLGWKVKWQFAPSWRYPREAWQYGLRGHLSVILDTINLRFDQLVLGVMINPVELGWYSIAVSLCEMPQLLPDSIGVVLFPRVAGDPVAAASLTARACRVTIIVMTVVCLALIALAAPVIRVVYGPAFLPAVKAIVILAPSLIFLSISKILTKYIYGVGRPHLGVVPTVVSSLLTISLIFPMVRHHGMIGAAATSTVAYCAGAICNLVVTSRLSGTRVLDFLVVRKTDFQLNLRQL